MDTTRFVELVNATKTMAKMLIESADQMLTELSPVPVPPVPAVPPVSVEPSIKPDLIENMVLKDGVWVSIPGWEKTTTALGFKLDFKYGSKVELSFMREAKYPTDGNIKVLRIWPGGKVGGYPNTYLGQPSNKDDFFIYTEKLDLHASRRPLKGWYFSNGVARRERYVFTYPSDFGRNNGKFQLYLNDVLCGDVQDWKCEDSLNRGLPNFFVIQDDPARTFPSDSYVKVWDIRVTVTP